jgi:cell division protein FtsA
VNKSILAIDIGTTSVVCVIAQNDLNNKINILGMGINESNGIKKGAIVDIHKASSSIKIAVDLARSASTSEITDTVVSVSGIHTKSIRSSGVITIPSGHITQKEISQVLTMALYDASIIPNYEMIHVIPIHFKVDDTLTVDNPLNMNGSRLEVYANIITAKKTSLNNIQNALKESNLEVSNFVLSSYASAISTLDEDQKKLGTAVVDLGGSTSELAIYQNRSLIFSDIVPIGSVSITEDLSIMLHTPINAANEVKKKYASLYPKDIDNTNTITKVKLPILGNESESSEVSLDLIQPMVHARVEEILCLLEDKLDQNGLRETVNSLILTGGMSKIPGIDSLTKKIFAEFNIKISNPRNIQNGYIDFQDPTYSTIVGLLFYSLEDSTFFELNSKKQLKEKLHFMEAIKEVIINEDSSKNNFVSEDNSDTLESLKSIEQTHKKQKKSIWDKIMKKFGELL